jgi:hypothetical protein
MHQIANKRYLKTMGQSRITNAEPLATLGTRHRTDTNKAQHQAKNHTRKNKTQHGKLSS